MSQRIATSVSFKGAHGIQEMRSDYAEESNQHASPCEPGYEVLTRATLLLRKSSIRAPRAMGDREIGGILLELLLVLGFLGSVILAAFDYHSLSVAYVNIGQAAREGVFAVSDIIEFRGGVGNVACSGSDYSELHDLIEDPRCNGPKSEIEKAKCAHSFIHLKIENRLKLMDLNRVDLEKVLITTRCRRIGVSSAEFEVMVTGSFRGISPFYRNSLITVKRLGLIK